MMTFLTSRGIVLWAVLLGSYLVQNQEIIRNKRVLELGAGSGIPSLAALYAGASHVTVTDRPDVLPLLQANIDRNIENSSNIENSENHKNRISVAPFDWLEAEQSELWEKEYDVIIGADLVYAVDLFESLERVLQHYLSKGTKAVYLAARIRYPKDEAFFQRLTQHLQVTLAYSDPSCDTNRIYMITKRLS